MDKLEELRLRYLHSLPQKAADVRAQLQRLQQQPDERALLVELHPPLPPKPNGTGAGGA